jgi:hypothetical protein
LNWRRDGPWAASAAAYAGLAIAVTYPLVTRLGAAIPAGWGDPLLNAWILWWNASTVPFTAAWWNAPAFYPAEGVLAFSDNLFGLTPIASPVIWLTGNVQLAYNLTFVLTFVLSALGGYALCAALTDRRDAAFVGGLLFGFAPYRIDQVHHLQVLASFYMPLALVGLHRYVTTGQRRWLVLFGTAWLLQGLTNGYHLVFFSILVAGWLAWFLPWRRASMVRAVAVAWALPALATAPVLLRYREIHHAYGFTRPLEEIARFGADLTSLLSAPRGLVVWQALNVFERPEGALFPGVAGVLLVLAGVIVARTNVSGRTAARWASAGLVACAALFGTVAVLAARAPWRTTFGVWQISSHDAERPALVAALCLLAAAAISPRVRSAVRRRSPFAFYALAAAAAWVLCLGPQPTLLGEPALSSAPYDWLLMIPGLDALRVPPRFAMVMALCLSTAGALAFARLAQAASRTVRVALMAVVVAIAVGDTWTGGLALDPQPRAAALQRRELPGPVLELPMGDPIADALVMYRHIASSHPVVNGYSGHFPAWYARLHDGLERREPEWLEALGALGVTQIVIGRFVRDAPAWQQYLASSATLVEQDASHSIYRLRSPPDRTRPLGPPLPIASVHATVNPDMTPALTDGDLRSRWHSNAQDGAEALTIDLGAPSRVGAVALALGPFHGDAPIDLAIELSADGLAWTPAWRGKGRVAAFVGSVRDPRRAPATFDIGDQSARFLRLRQLGADPVYYWSVAELQVLAPR